MPWPPRVGELLPRHDEPLGIEKRLRTYSLVIDHESGGPKANGFQVILGMDLSAVDHLAEEIRTGIAITPIRAVHLKEPAIARCTVQFQIAGIGRYSRRRAWLRTGWRLDGPGARPLLATAFLRGREGR
jgi:hypothetical protein